MKINYVLKKLTAQQENAFSDILKYARTTKQKDPVGSKIFVLINMRNILTKTSVSWKILQIMKKK